LKRLRKYKYAFAIVLMALYIFAVVPVQYWHQHSPSANAALFPQVATDADVLSSAAGDASGEDNCRLCAHDYAVYNDDAVFTTNIFNPAVNPKEQYCDPAIPPAPFFDAIGRGPPAAVCFLFTC
jgi:hypothetical protein